VRLTTSSTTSWPYFLSLKLMLTPVPGLLGIAVPGQ